MESQIATFSTFEEADEADARYYASLSGQERLEIVVELASRYWGAQIEDSGRLARVYRVDELSRR